MMMQIPTMKPTLMGSILVATDDNIYAIGPTTTEMKTETSLVYNIAPSPTDVGKSTWIQHLVNVETQVNNPI
jgi:hypothetical protein